LADAKIFFIESDRPVTKKNGAGGIWRMDNHGLRKKGGGQGLKSHSLTFIILVKYSIILRLYLTIVGQEHISLSICFK
jgi:hypothetical protein